MALDDSAGLFLFPDRTMDQRRTWMIADRSDKAKRKKNVAKRNFFERSGRSPQDYKFLFGMV
jgi:hypothetical protein